jgi:hypothetical protein
MALKRILRQLQKNNSRLESLRAAMQVNMEKVSGATAEHKPHKNGAIVHTGYNISPEPIHLQSHEQST